ncbi:MAG: alanine dehydrogenase [Candidatus Promineifilaceae bacterium]|nr:alanine dehydrogenase [Candidatus Promineifilaceae bacterium]
MELGVPKEVRDLEMRVGLTPAGVLTLAEAGHKIYVERGAGAQAGFSDDHFRQAGAEIVYSAAEVYGRAEVIAKVTRPTLAEHGHFRQGQIIFSFLHLSVSSPDLLKVLVERQVTAIAYELIQQENGLLPVLVPMSEIAGRLAPIIAGQLLMNLSGGRGTLLSGIPGVPPAAVVIIGGGMLGFNAARAFIGLGAQVTVLDRNADKLRQLETAFAGQVTTMLANEYNLQRAVEFADVLVGCVLIPGQRAPVLISRTLVRRMRPGAVILDFSIDQGGCVATSRPTTLRDQTYVEEGIIHFCVPNFTAAVARTTSYAINNAAIPYLLSIGRHGLLGPHEHVRELANGINLYRGQLAHPTVARALGRPVEVDLTAQLGAGDKP